MEKYKKSLEEAIQISAQHNIPPIPGRTVILMSVDSSMYASCHGAKELAISKEVSDTRRSPPTVSYTTQSVLYEDPFIILHRDICECFKTCVIFCYQPYPTRSRQRIAEQFGSLSSYGGYQTKQETAANLQIKT